MLRVTSEIVAVCGPSIDDRILARFAVERSNVATAIMVIFTSLGDGAVLALIVVLSAIALARAGRSAEGRFLVLTGVCAGVSTVVLKNSFARPRPEGLGLVAAGGYSFPSGHSLASAAVYVSLALVAVRTWPRHTLAIWTLAGVVISAIGVSRAYLGVHYPSDILAGWACGAFLAFGLSFVLLGPRKAVG